MILGPHVLPGAWFDTLGCVGLMRDAARVRQLEAFARGLEASVDPITREAGRQLREGILQARASAARWAAVRSGGSDVGTTEPPGVEEGAESLSPPSVGEDSSEYASARQVASECRVSESYVTRLCRNGTPLRGRLVGGRWFIEKSSVAEWQARRRPVG